MKSVFNFERSRFIQCIPGLRRISSYPQPSRNQKEKILEVEDIPGPRLLPIIGSLLDTLLYKHGISKAVFRLQQDRVAEFGNIYFEKFTGSVKSIHIADPNDVELIFRNESAYPKRMMGRPLFEYFWKKYNREPGIFFENGIKWYRYRSSLSKKMLLPRSIAQHTPEMNKIASDFIARLKALYDPAECSETNNEVSNIDWELFKWSFESVSYVMFEKRFQSIGDNVDPKVEEFIQAIGNFLGAIVPTVFFPPKMYDYYQTEAFKTFSSSYDKMYDLAEYFILQQTNRLEQSGELCYNSEEELSLFQYLVLKKSFSEKELLYCIIDLLFAGIDTTSNTMQWVLYELAKNPEKQAVLFDEITAVVPDKQMVSNDQLQNLPYLKAVVKETLRLHPVLPTLRRVLQQDLVLSRYKVPAGTPAVITAYSLSHDPNVFYNPEQFLPERWLRSNKKGTFHKFGATPFGFGRRMCLGRRLAELEMHVLLFHIMVNFHLKYPKYQRMDTIGRGTLIPEKPVRVKFIERV